MAIYNPGNNKVIKAPKNRRPLKKLAKLGFKLLSSGELKKSIKIEGIIIPYGVPFTITTTLPLSKYLLTLSGLSVESTWGIPKTLESIINCSNSPAESKESISRLFNLYFTSFTKSELVIFFI